MAVISPRSMQWMRYGVAGIGVGGVIALGISLEVERRALRTDIATLVEAQSVMEKTLTLELHSRLTSGDVEAQIAPLAARVSQLSQATLRHMALAESAALVQMAAARIQNVHEIPIALHQLKTADAQLVSLENPAFWPIREALSPLILALSNISSAQWEDRWLLLNAMSEQLEALPWMMAPTPSPTVEISTDKNISLWEVALERIWREIRGLVRIRSVSTEGRAIITVEERTLLIQALQLSLEEAKWALIQQNDTVYKESIQWVIHRIENCFQNEDPAVQAMLAQLHRLHAGSAAISLPDFSAVLSLYQQALTQDAGAL